MLVLLGDEQPLFLAGSGNDSGLQMRDVHCVIMSTELTILSSQNPFNKSMFSCFKVYLFLYFTYIGVLSARKKRALDPMKQ